METFHNIGSMNDKIREADPNLESSMTICQSIEKMLLPDYKLNGEKKKTNTVHTTLYEALPKRPTLILTVSNVLNHCVPNNIHFTLFFHVPIYLKLTVR